MTRALVVDDHAVAARGTASILEESGFATVGIATSLDEATELAIRTRPDVVVCDVMLGGEPTGLDLPARLAGTPAADAAVLFLSSYSAPWFVTRAVKDGGSGYLLKSAPVEELVAAVRTVATGGVAFRAAALRTANAHKKPTDRELEIIRLVMSGSSNGEIGSHLRITDKTVETHLNRMYTRYGVTGRAQLALHAIHEGWLPDVASR